MDVLDSLVLFLIVLKGAYNLSGEPSQSFLYPNKTSLKCVGASKRRLLIQEKRPFVEKTTQPIYDNVLFDMSIYGFNSILKEKNINTFFS